MYIGPIGVLSPASQQCGRYTWHYFSLSLLSELFSQKGLSQGPKRLHGLHMQKVQGPHSPAPWGVIF
jgi:hypothetical protein